MQYESYCVLIANAKSNVTKKRMSIMTESTDGFFISEQDMKLRGTGEVFGMRQSGDEGLVLADIYEDINILKCARGEANKMLESEDLNNKRLVYEVKQGLRKK